MDQLNLCSTAFWEGGKIGESFPTKDQSASGCLHLQYSIVDGSATAGQAFMLFEDTHFHVRMDRVDWKSEGVDRIETGDGGGREDGRVKGVTGRNLKGRRGTGCVPD